MAQPQVLTYGLAAASNTVVVNAASAIFPNFTLNSTVLDNQRRLTFTVAGNESGNTFTIVGLNANNATVTENITGTNTGTFSSQLDYKTIIKISALATTAGTISVGTQAIGASLWQIVNSNAAPVNIGFGMSIQSGSTNYTLQYTYDDPNNLPSAITSVQAFNHPTLVSTTSNADGALNDPIFAWRLLVNSGTGTVRATAIEAGLGSP